MHGVNIHGEDNCSKHQRIYYILSVIAGLKTVTYSLPSKVPVCLLKVMAIGDQQRSTVTALIQQLQYDDMIGHVIFTRLLNSESYFEKFSTLLHEITVMSSRGN